MIFNAARLSLANLFAPETSGVFWKVIGLTVLALVVLWFALRESFVAFRHVLRNTGFSFSITTKTRWCPYRLVTAGPRRWDTVVGGTLIWC